MRIQSGAQQPAQEEQRWLLLDEDHQMNPSPRTQAILLLAAGLPGARKDDPQPLSPSEWGRLVPWLTRHNLSPESLLMEDPAVLMAGWEDRTITVERLRFLLGRGTALALAMEEWQRVGLWVLTRSDATYPLKLKSRLKEKSPPVLFGCGDKILLDNASVAVIGSRNATEGDQQFTTELARYVADQGYSVVSGGARGIDQVAMLSALEAGGTAIGVLSDSLIRAATSGVYRDSLIQNRLVLISAVHPKAGFDVGTAMGRNKYIYTLSEGAVVVATDFKKGGTWNGAIENLRNGWVPVRVWRGTEPSTGKQGLVEAGATWLDSPSDLNLNTEPVPLSEEQKDEVNSRVEEPTFETRYRVGETSSREKEIRTNDKSPALQDETGPAEDPVSTPPSNSTRSAPLSLYETFLLHFQAVSAYRAVEPKDLAEILDLELKQVKAWLHRAVGENHAFKFDKPERYTWNAPQGTLDER